MVVRIDKLGRIVLPKAMRDRLKLPVDSKVEAVESPEGILIRVASPIKEVDGFLVHTGVPDPDIDWDNIIDQDREERIQFLITASGF